MRGKESSLLFLASASVLLLSIFGNLQARGESVSGTWVTVDGVVSSYGSDQAYGWTSVSAVVENWADGWCVFTVPPLPQFIIQIFPPPSFNFTLYLARIVNASAVKLNYNSCDLWISGFWGVGYVKNPRSIADFAEAFNMTVAAGELSVTGNWTFFTINIEGFEAIQGNVTYHSIRGIDDITERFPRCDLNCDYKIDMRDIGICCRAYGSFLGFDRYDFRADVNFDMQIDMRDVSAVARNFGERY
jgi:hypothetical protein